MPTARPKQRPTAEASGERMGKINAIVPDALRRALWSYRIATGHEIGDTVAEAIRSYRPLRTYIDAAESQP